MTYYSKCMRYIESATDKNTLYDGVRAILLEAVEKSTWLKDYYPPDHQIKTIQRTADAKYIELGDN